MERKKREKGEERWMEAVVCISVCVCVCVCADITRMLLCKLLSLNTECRYYLSDVTLQIIVCVHRIGQRFYFERKKKGGGGRSNVEASTRTPV